MYIIITIKKVFLQCKILSIDYSKRARAHTHKHRGTHTHEHADYTKLALHTT